MIVHFDELTTFTYRNEAAGKGRSGLLIRLLIGLTIFLLAACDSDTPGIEFPSFPAGFFSDGYSESYELSGTSSGGNPLTGNLSITTLEPEIFNGLMTTPIEVSLELVNSTSNTSLVSKEIQHYLVSDTAISLVGITSNEITLLPEAITLLPAIVKTGESGSFGRFNDNQGNSIIISWSLKELNRTNATYTIVQNQTNSNGDLVLISEQSRDINQEGVWQEGRIDLFYPQTDSLSHLRAIRN